MKDKILENLASQCGLTYVTEPEAAAYGVFANFGLVVKHLVSEHQFILLVSARPTSNEGVNAMVASLNQFVSDRKKTVNHASYLDMVVTISIRDKGNNTISALKEAVEAATYFCNQYGFVPACKYCGNQTDLGFFAIGGNVDTMCTECFNNNQMQMSNKAMTEANKQFNLPLGVLGAVLGALAGGAIWIITYQMGFLLFITGAVIVFLSCMLLNKMGGKFTTGGLVTALIISFAMIFIAEYLALGISFFIELNGDGYSFGEAFSYLNLILFGDDYKIVFGYGTEMARIVNNARGEVASDLVYGVLSYAVAAVLFVVQYVKNKKVKYQAIRLG